MLEKSIGEHGRRINDIGKVHENGWSENMDTLGKIINDQVQHGEGRLYLSVAQNSKAMKTQNCLAPITRKRGGSSA